MNATQAAIRAGYSERTANEIGAENLAKPSIAAAIRESEGKRLKRTEITADWALERLKREAELEGKGSSHSARVTAVGLALKHLGLLVDQVEMKQKTELVIVEQIVDAATPPDNPNPPDPG